MPHRLDYRGPSPDREPASASDPPPPGRLEPSGRVLFWVTWVAVGLLLSPLMVWLLSGFRAAR